MKEQVLSIEQMQRLKELGIDTSKAKMAWYAIYETEPNWYNELNIRDDIFDKNYPSVPTFTLQDILEMMPRTIYWNEDTYHFEMLKGESGYTICYGLINDNNDLMYCMIIHESNVIDCAYETLCWCAKNRHLKGGEK